jgi:hypothetical protein
MKKLLHEVQGLFSKKEDLDTLNLKAGSTFKDIDGKIHKWSGSAWYEVDINGRVIKYFPAI